MTISLNEILSTSASSNHNHDTTYATINELNGVKSQLDTVNTQLATGKSQLASAISGKGVSTSSADALTTMASKINQIPVSNAKLMTIDYGNTRKPVIGERTLIEVASFPAGTTRIILDYFAAKNISWTSSNSTTAYVVPCLTDSKGARWNILPTSQNSNPNADALTIDVASGICWYTNRGGTNGGTNAASDFNRNDPLKLQFYFYADADSTFVTNFKGTFAIF